MKKKSFKSKAVKFFTICSPSLQEPAFQVSVFQALASASSPISHRSTKSSSAAFTSYRSLVSFWDTFQTKLADKSPYTASIKGIRLRLAKLQESDKKAQKLRVTAELKKGLSKYIDVDEVLHYQELLFVLEPRRPSGRLF